MAIENWTGADYAKAAIDMLPGSVEEIAEFMVTEKIGNHWTHSQCPIERWVARWVGHQVWTGGEAVLGVKFPKTVQAYIQAVDRKSLV